MIGGLIGDRLRAKVELLGWAEGDALSGKEGLEIIDATLQVIDVVSRNLPLCVWIIPGALEAELLTGGTCRQVLVALVLPHSASVAGRDVAERGGGGCQGRGGKRRAGGG